MTKSAAQVIAMRELTAEHVLLRVRPEDPGLAAENSLAGQHINLSDEDGQGFAAPIASAPGVGQYLEILSKASHLKDNLGPLAPGATLYLGKPAGRGFDLESGYGRDVLIMAMGLAVASARSLIESILPDREAFGVISTYLGAKGPQALPFFDEIPRWNGFLLGVSPCLSQPDAALRPGWRIGHVQNALLEDRLTSERVSAFVAGSQQMVDECRQAITSLGLPGEHIHVAR